MRTCFVPAVLAVMFVFIPSLSTDLQQLANETINVLLGLPLGSIFVTAIAAFVTYYFWSAYNRPYLTVEGHDSLDLIMPQEHKNNKKKHRLAIRNLGRVPATNCRAFFQIKGEKTGGHRWDHLIFINMPLAWYNKRGHLFTNQIQDYSEERTLSPGEQEYVDLFEQPHGQLRPYDWVDPSERPILHVWENNRGEYDINEIKNSVIFRDSSNEHNTDDLSYEQKRFLGYGTLRDYDWNDGKIILVTDEGGRTIHRCDFDWSDEDELHINIKKKSGIGHLKHRIRQIDHKIWN